LEFFHWHTNYTQESTKRSKQQHNMKIFLSALLVTSSTAFLHSAQVRSGTTLRVQSRGDSSKATSEALETTKLHGTSSIIAKVAWDIVEEINASDNR
jgi:hypothetical protein